MFGLPPAEVEEIECQVAREKYGRGIWPDNPPRGREGCLYRVRWRPMKLPLLKRFFVGWKRKRQAVEELLETNKLIQAQYDEVKRLAADLEKTNRRLLESQRELQAKQAALIDSERRYRILAENVSDTIWSFDLETMKFAYISPSVMQHRGFAQEEATALDLEQSLSPRSLASVKRILEEELANEHNPDADPMRARRIEVENSVKGGGYRWAEAIVSFWRDGDGKPSALMGVTRDISERKEAERKIAESEKKYRNLFENCSDLLCVHDLEGNLLETNLPFKKEYGWRKEDLDGLNIRNLVPEKFKPDFDSYLERILSKGFDEGYLKALSKSGREVILEYRNKLILDGEGKPVAVQAAARDVTRKIVNEKALKESEEKYKQIVKYAPPGILELDMRDFKFLSANDVMCEYAECGREELDRKDFFDFLADEGRETVFELFERVFSGERDPAAVGFVLRGKNGRELPVIADSKFLFSGGVPEKAMMVLHDLTELKRAEEEKKILEDKLRNAKRLEALGTLAGGVAHELNNILSGIVGYPDLLLKDLKEDSPFRKPLSIVKRSGEKAAEIVQDLLTLARRNVSAKTQIDINRVLNEFLISPEYRKIIGAKDGLVVETNLADDVFPIAGSDTHISKTVMNLTANAADAMPAGGRIGISTRNVRIETPHAGFETVPEGDYAVLEISDTGIGMQKCDLEKIFEPFFHQEGFGAEERHGTGHVGGVGYRQGPRGFHRYRDRRKFRDRVFPLFSGLAEGKPAVRVRFRPYRRLFGQRGVRADRGRHRGSKGSRPTDDAPFRLRRVHRGRGRGGCFDGSKALLRSADSGYDYARRHGRPGNVPGNPEDRPRTKSRHRQRIRGDRTRPRDTEAMRGKLRQKTVHPGKNRPCRQGRTGSGQKPAETVFSLTKIKFPSYILRRIVD